jgi:hypothetical protein
MKGFPVKFKQEIETLIWDFTWDGKVNKIEEMYFSVSLIGTLQ